MKLLVFVNVLSGIEQGIQVSVVLIHTAHSPQAILEK